MYKEFIKSQLDYDETLYDKTYNNTFHEKVILIQ